MPVKQVEGFGAYVDFPVTKCLIVGDGGSHGDGGAAAEGAAGRGVLYFPVRALFSGGGAQGHRQGPVPGDRLNTYLGKRADDTAAFGDGFNDCSMIGLCRSGVAMGNAQDAVKDVADEITGTNDADGVAVVVERFLQEI